MLLGWMAAAASGLARLLRWAGSTFARYLLRVNRSGPKRHSGEIWGAIASTDYKNFLRMKIDSDERLTIYPVGIRQSVEWRFEPDGGEDDPWFVPAGRCAGAATDRAADRDRAVAQASAGACSICSSCGWV